MNGFEAIREIYNLTLEDIAELLGITKQSVSEWTKVGRKVPKKRAEELGFNLHIPSEFFRISEVSNSDKLEIRSCYLNKLLMETEELQQEEFRNQNGGISMVIRYTVDEAIVKQIEYNDREIEINNLLNNEIRVIKECSLDDQDSDIKQMDKLINVFNRLVNIVESHHDNKTFYKMLRGMELAFNVNAEKFERWREESNVYVDSVSDDDITIQSIVSLIDKDMEK